jgi:hypothetical protein
MQQGYTDLAYELTTYESVAFMLPDKKCCLGIYEEAPTCSEYGCA